MHAPCHGEKAFCLWDLVGEIVLQQTRVNGHSQVARLRGTFPTWLPWHLPLKKKSQAWEGLGYYRRARLLHRAAQAIHDAGRYPKPMPLAFLPGIGPIPPQPSPRRVWGPVAAVDGNVRRVASGWNGVTEAVDSKPASNDPSHCRRMARPRRPGRHNQPSWKSAPLYANRKRRNAIDAFGSTCRSANNPELWGVLPVKQPKKKPSLVVALACRHLGLEGCGHSRLNKAFGPTCGCSPSPLPLDNTDLGRAGRACETHPDTQTHRSDVPTLCPGRAQSPSVCRSTGGLVMSWVEFGNRPRPRLYHQGLEGLLRKRASWNCIESIIRLMSINKVILVGNLGQNPRCVTLPTVWRFVPFAWPPPSPGSGLRNASPTQVAQRRPLERPCRNAGNRSRRVHNATSRAS